MQKIVILLIPALAYCLTGSAQHLLETAVEAPTANEQALAYYTKGYEAFHRHRFKKAIKLYKQAISHDPAFTDAYDNCGLSFRYAGNLDSAEAYYRRSLQLRPEGMVARRNLAIVLEARGDLNAALREFERLQRANPDEAEAYYGAARLYISQQKPDEALKNAQQALAIYQAQKSPFVGDAEFFIGLAYYLKKEKTRAKMHFEEAARLGTQLPQALRLEFGL